VEKGSFGASPQIGWSARGVAVESDGSLHDKLRIWPTADTTGNDFPSFFPQFVQFYFEFFVIGMAYNLVFPHSHEDVLGRQHIVVSPYPLNALILENPIYHHYVEIP